MSIFSKWFSNKGSDSEAKAEPKKPQISAADYCEQGQKSLDAGKYVEAMEYFQATIEADKHFEKAYLLLASAYEKQGKKDKAKAALYGLLAIDPNNTEALKRIRGEVIDNNKNVVASFSSNNTTNTSNSLTATSSNASTQSNMPLSSNDYDVSVDNEQNRFYYKIFGDEAYVVCPKRCKFNLVFSGWEGFREPEGKVKIPSFVLYNGKWFRVSKIQEYAFCHCGEIVSVDIPSSVQSIGNHAFAYCNKLKSVAIPFSVVSIDAYAFTDCSIKTINFPSSIKSIGAKAFCGNPLTDFVFPNSIQEIDASIIGGGYTSITIPASVRTMKGYWGNRLTITMKGHPPVIQGSIEQHTKVLVPSEFYDEYYNAVYWQTCDLRKMGKTTSKVQLWDNDTKPRKTQTNNVEITPGIIALGVLVIAVLILICFYAEYIIVGIGAIALIFEALFGKRR